MFVVLFFLCVIFSVFSLVFCSFFVVGLCIFFDLSGFFVLVGFLFWGGGLGFVVGFFFFFLHICSMVQKLENEYETTSLRLIEI